MNSMAQPKQSSDTAASSIRAVAKAAGVSTATVSRVLREDPRVREATRQKVKAIVQELGYVPDRQLSEVLTQASRKRRRQEVLKIALPFRADSSSGQQRCNDLVAGAQDYGAKLGYVISVFDIDTLPKDLTGFAGVMLTDYAVWHDSHYTWVNEFKGAMVAIEPNSMNCTLDTVAGNHWQSMQRVLDECATRGYKRPGAAIQWGTNRSSGFQWLAACRQWCEDHDLSIPPPFTRSLTKHYRIEFTDWIDNHGIDVVISRSSARHLVEHHHQHVGYVNLGVLSQESTTSGMLQNYFELGREAIRLLDSRLRLRQVGLPERPSMQLVTLDWHQGTTLPSV